MITPELAAQILNTAAFIEANPTWIELIPRVRDRTPAGGWQWRDLAPRPIQKLRLIEQSGTSSPPMVATADGTQRQAEFMVLGLPDAEMGVDDHWKDLATGREWEIRDIVRPNGYEQRGLVVERGK